MAARRLLSMNRKFGDGQNRTPVAHKMRMSNVQPSIASDRFSLAGYATSGRRSSFFKPPPMKDNRPIGSKEYQVAMQRKILSFLHDHCGMTDLPENVVKSPTKTDFGMIFECIYQTLDANYKVGKMEDEVPKIFKGLGYSPSIKPSSMQTVSAPHVWPHLCAALVWLIDYVQMYNSVVPSDILLTTDEQRTNNEAGHRTIKYLSLQAAFRESFMHNVQPDEEFINKNIASFRKLLEDNCNVDGQLKETEAANALIQEEIEAMKNDHGKEEVLKHEVTSLHTDIRAAQSYLTDLERTVPQYERAYDENKRSLHSMEEELKRLQDSVAQKQELINQQNVGHGLSGDEARKLMREIAANKDELSNLSDVIDPLAKDLWKETPKVKAAFKEAVVRYQEWYRSVIDIERKVNSAGASFNELDVQTPCPADARELLNLVVNDSHKLIMRIQQLIENHKRESHSAFNQADREIVQLREHCMELEEKLEKMKKEEERENRQRKREREVWTKNVGLLEMQVDSLESEKERLADKDLQIVRFNNDIEIARNVQKETMDMLNSWTVNFNTKFLDKLAMAGQRMEDVKEAKAGIRDAISQINNKIQNIDLLKK